MEQAKTIDKLQKEIKLMSEKIREMSNAVEGDIPNRKPNWNCQFLVYFFRKIDAYILLRYSFYSCYCGNFEL